MEANFGKLFIAAGSGLLGAILGGCLAGWRAAAAVAKNTAGMEEPDPLAQASPHVIGPQVAAVFHGVLIGGILGIVLAVAAMIFFSIERVRDDRPVEDPGE
jgi:fructose-specific phosphotransferase system IIC component